MKALRTLNPYFWKYRRRLFVGMGFVLLTNVLAVFAPALVGEGINSLRDAYVNYLEPLNNAVGDVEVEAVFDKSVGIPLPLILSKVANFIGLSSKWNSEVSSISEVHALVIAISIFQALLYLFTYLIKGVFLFFTRQTIIVNSRFMEFDLKERIYAHYQKLDSSFYKSHDTGDLMNRISEDVSKVRMYLGPAVMYTMNLGALIILVVSVMLMIDVKLTLYALLPLPLMSICIYLISSKINIYSDAVASKQSDLSSFVQQHISGIRVLQSYHREAMSARRFDTESDKYKGHVLKLVKVEALFMPIILLLVGLSTVITVYVGGIRVMEGELEIGHIFQFVFYVNLLTWPFASVGWVTSLVQKAEASMARILDFLETEPEIESPSSAINLNEVDDFGMSFKNVSYVYPETGIQAIEGLSFDLKFGTTVAITGRTGSGKSTIAQLTMRMMDPSSGSITFNGHSLTKLDLNDFRKTTGYVPQDVFLFSDTITKNIAFGYSNDLEGSNLSALVKAAAEDAGVSSDIDGFKKGYDTILGERGVNLSGGQKQRISIARALIRKPQLLILDDCLSAVDTATEDHILNSINKDARERCTLVISHRISSIRNADLIILLDNGKVIESGSHSELLKKDGEYAKMHAQQQLL